MGLLEEYGHASVRSVQLLAVRVEAVLQLDLALVHVRLPAAVAFLRPLFGTEATVKTFFYVFFFKLLPLAHFISYANLSLSLACFAELAGMSPAQRKRLIQGITVLRIAYVLQGLSLMSILSASCGQPISASIRIGQSGKTHLRYKVPCIKGGQSFAF